METHCLLRMRGEQERERWGGVGGVACGVEGWGSKGGDVGRDGRVVIVGQVRLGSRLATWTPHTTPPACHPHHSRVWHISGQLLSCK